MHRDAVHELETHKSYINPGSARKKSPENYPQIRQDAKKSPESRRPLAPRVIRAGGVRGVRGSGGGGTPMGPPPRIPLWPQGSAIVRARLRRPRRPWPCTGTPSTSLKTRQISHQTGGCTKKSPERGRPLASR